MSYDSPTFVKTLRELCGQFYPEETDPDKRFALTVDSINAQVPIFVGRQTPAEYPEIRITPFFMDTPTYYGKGSYYTPGSGEREDPNVEYRRGGTHLFLREIRSVIDIYTKNLEDTVYIRDELMKRLNSFILFEGAAVRIYDTWENEDDGNLYINRNYDTRLSILRVFEDEILYLKTPDYADTPNSWYVDDEAIYVNTASDIREIDFYKNVNNGLVFHDGSDLFGRGFLSFRVVRSEPKEEKEPYVSHWSIQTHAKYQEVVELDVGESFKQVNVNG